MIGRRVKLNERGRKAYARSKLHDRLGTIKEVGKKYPIFYVVWDGRTSREQIHCNFVEVIYDHRPHS